MAEPALEASQAVAFGEALRAADYSVDPSILPAPGEAAPGATLRRLFSVGAAVPRADADLALEPVLLDALMEAGFVERCSEGRVRSRVRITPFEGLLLAHDPPDPRGAGDQVAPVGPASATLANLTVRRPVDSALDLGTGCGVQALLAARFSTRVVATDVNERALAIAAINARLNGVSNVEFRLGDLFEPVGDERFDVIITNPPFVISPETSHVYRDSQLSGDELSRTVVARSAEHLAPGGHATVLCEWIVRAGESWMDAPRGWTGDGDCDALTLHYATAQPESYAASWNVPLRSLDPDAYVDAVERWANYQHELGGAGVSTGAIVLRRRLDGAPWFHGEEMPRGPQGQASDHLVDLFAGRDRLQRDGCDELLDAVLEPVDGQVLVQRLLREDGAWTTPEVGASVEPGIGLHVALGPALVHVLLSLDPDRPLRRTVEQTAGDLGADPATLRREAAEMAERLVGLGMCRVRTPR